MTDTASREKQEPVGLGEHARSLNSERAHEQGWGLNEEERTQLPEGKQSYQGGTDYEYGARNFGDSPVDTSSTPAASPVLERAEEFRGTDEAERKH